MMIYPRAEREGIVHGWPLDSFYQLTGIPETLRWKHEDDD